MKEGEGVMEGQIEGKRVVVLASHFVRGQPFSFVSGRLRSWVVVLVGGRSSSFAGVVSVFVHGRLSSFMGGVHVLGVRHVCVGVIGVHVVVCGRRIVVLGGGARSRAVYVVHGWGA